MADSTEAKDEKKPEAVVPKDTAEKKLDGVLEPVAAKDSSIKSGLGAQGDVALASLRSLAYLLFLECCIPWHIRRLCC